MKLRSFRFYFEEAFGNLVRNKSMAFSSAITVASCIFILSISFCIVQNINYAMVQLGDSVGLSVIVKDDLSADKVNVLYEKMLAVPYIDDIKFITAEEAFEQLKETLDDSAEMLDSLKDDNPLPRSFDITLKDNRFYSKTIEILEQMRGLGIENIKHAKEETDILLSISKIVHIISALVILILGINSVIIIINTIKLAVNSRKEEISIMKYIGATNWFIRWPFLIEGMIIGFIGSVIPLAISWPCYNKLTAMIYERLLVVRDLFKFQHGLIIFSQLIPIALTLGVFIGILGSFVSVRKYLKV